MDRKEELFSLLRNRALDEPKARRLIDEIVFLEERMEELKKFPFISVNPKNPAQQKPTAAAKQYKEFLQQYNNSLRLLLRISGDIGDDVEEISPLRAWAAERNKRDQGA